MIKKSKQFKYFSSLITVFAMLWSVGLNNVPLAHADAVTWVGRAEGTWETSDNWSTGLVPTNQDNVVINSSVDNVTVTVSAGQAINFASLVIGGDRTKSAKVILNGDIAAGVDLTVTSNGTLSTANKNSQGLRGTLSIESGGLLTHEANLDRVTSTINFSVANLNVASGGQINANGKGYSGGAIVHDGNGPGAGLYSSTDSVGSGGGYGGSGGKATLSGPIGSAGGSVNGSNTTPELSAGSGGAGSRFSAGGNGGGIMKFIVRGTATVNGSITANGNNGQAICGTTPAGPTGAGAGGGIRIETNTLAGTGSITAKGGDGPDNGFSCAAANGGGGRILISVVNSSFRGTVSVAGGLNSMRDAAGGAGSLENVVPTPTTALDSMIQPPTPVVTLPGPVSLFFRDVGQRIQLLFTFDPVKDADKRIQFAQDNITLAQTIISATTDVNIQARAGSLISRANDLSQAVLDNQDKWMKGDATAVAALSQAVTSYFVDARAMFDQIASVVTDQTMSTDIKTLSDNLVIQQRDAVRFAQTPPVQPVRAILRAVPNNDQDHDGIPDDMEKDLGTKPADFDSDGDGLSDRAEIEKYGTDPNNPDTDGDGYRDGVEVLKGYNPLGSGLLDNTKIIEPTKLKFITITQPKLKLTSTTFYLQNVLKNYQFIKK